MTNEEEQSVNPMKLVGIVISRLPSLLFRSAGELLRFRAKARKAGRIFQDELCQQGVDPEVAEQLTGVYLEGSNPLSYLRVGRQSHQ